MKDKKIRLLTSFFPNRVENLSDFFVHVPPQSCLDLYLFALCIYIFTMYVSRFVIFVNVIKSFGVRVPEPRIMPVLAPIRLN